MKKILVKRRFITIEVEPNQWLRGSEEDPESDNGRIWMRDALKGADLIRKAVRALDFNSGAVSDDIEVEARCSYCGRSWTENGRDYNGGCCDEDEKNNPNPEQESK